MAAQKPTAELIAIYRLEFYKKQKNWKLSSDTRKEKELENACPTSPTKSYTLNETYNIDSNGDHNNSLNDAFLKDDSDKDTPTSPSTPPTLCTEWLAPVNACEECQHNTAQQNPWADYVDDGFTSQDTMNKCSGDGNEFDGWTGGMVWTNSCMHQPGWTGDVPTLMNVQRPECPEQMAWSADTILYHQLDHLGQMTPWPDDQMWINSIWGEEELLVASLESVDEFMIGAHSAPHSSEVELRPPTEAGGGESNVSETSLSHMSGAELSEAVRRHTGSLRKLLREAGNRRKQRNTRSLDICAPDHFGLAPRDFFSTEYSYEAFPTRDIPSTPLSPIYLCRDAFTPLSPARYTPVPPIDPKDPFTPTSPIPPINKYKDTITPMSPTFRKDFTQPHQCRSVFTPPSPANLYRDGFLAGSYKNKVDLAFVGRGRGRLTGDRGVEA